MQDKSLLWYIQKLLGFFKAVSSSKTGDKLQNLWDYMMIKWDNVHYSLSTLLDKERNSFKEAYVF